MNNVSTASEIQGNQHLALMVGRAVIPAIIAIIYGVYKFLKLGFGISDYLNTYVPVFGGCASVTAIMAFASVLDGPRGHHFGKWIAAWSGFVPYFFANYIMGYSGCIRYGH